MLFLRISIEMAAFFVLISILKSGHFNRNSLWRELLLYEEDDFY